MHKPTAYTLLITAVILTGVLLLSGCPDISADPGKITGTLVNADSVSDGVMFLASVFNSGDDINTATPLGNIAQPIIGGTASGEAVDVSSDPVVFPGGTYQVSVLIDLDGSISGGTPLTAGDKVTIITVTVDGNEVFTLDFGGSGWLTY